MNKGVFWIVLMASLMVACGSSQSGPGRVRQERLHRCPDPRPEICTMDHNPVCAPVGEDVQTFSNGCDACSDRKIRGFYLGACPEPPEEPEPTQDPEPTADGED